MTGAVPINDLSRALRRDRDLILAAVTAVLEGGWLVHGPQHEAFVHELAALVGVSHAWGVASGTDALRLSLAAVCGDIAGRNVVVAPNAGGYAATAARSIGLDVRYADVDPVHHCLTPDSVRRAWDDQTAAVVMTHLYGHVAPVAELVALAAERGVAVVEDCAQALGAWGPEGPAGSMGTVATTSFYPTKPLAALGDGGAVMSTSSEVITTVKSLSQYGWDTKYVVTSEGGINSRLDELQAAVLRARLPRVLDDAERRRAILSRYADAASPPMRFLPVSAGHAAHLAVAETPDRGVVRDHLSRHGVQTAVHYPIPDHLQPAWRRDEWTERLPVATSVADRVLTLPLFAEMDEDEISRVCEALACGGCRP